MSLDQICNAVCLAIFEGLSGEDTIARVIDVIAEAEFGEGGTSLQKIEAELIEAARAADKPEGQIRQS